LVLQQVFPLFVASLSAYIMSPMKGVIIKRIIIWVVVSLFLCQPTFASTDICILGSQATKMTKAQMEDFYERLVAGRLLTGRGKILKLRKLGGEGLEGNHEATISCGSNVIVIIRTNEFGIKASGASIGTMVSFRGECTKMYKTYDTVYCHMKAVTR